MATELTPPPTPHTIDLSGLPEPTVREVLRIVREARELQAGGPADPATLRSPNQDDPERWSAEWRAFIASQPRRELTMDDSRESMYAGCGE